MIECALIAHSELLLAMVGTLGTDCTVRDVQPAWAVYACQDDDGADPVPLCALLFTSVPDPCIHLW